MSQRIEDISLQENCQTTLLGSRLRQLRADKSLYAIEKESGISRGTLQRYENGTQVPENEALLRLSKFYKIEFLNLKKLWVADLFRQGTPEREALLLWLKEEKIH
jgi:transcriptional regulator with XRE-family HTH domain